MRIVLTSSLAALVLFAAGARAADDAQAVLDRAIKAYGGPDKLAKLKTVQTKSKGTVEVAGGLSFTEETQVQLPAQFKSVTQLDVNGQSVTVTTVFDKDKGWVQAAGQTKELEGKALDETKELVYLMGLGRLTPLKDAKKYEVSLVGDDKVEGKPVVGIRVASKGHKDVNLYFSKDTGLLAKITRQALDLMTGQEIQEERIIQEYQPVDGIPAAKKAVINRDGKKFMEVEVQEVKHLESLDDSTFAKP